VSRIYVVKSRIQFASVKLCFFCNFLQVLFFQSSLKCNLIDIFEYDNNSYTFYIIQLKVVLF